MRHAGAQISVPRKLRLGTFPLRPSARLTFRGDGLRRLFRRRAVPWERVFLLGDVDLVNGAALKTHASRHSAHQGAAKNLAKCELVLGVALLMTQTLGNAHLPHSEERLGEVMMYTELMRACLRAAQADPGVEH